MFAYIIRVLSAVASGFFCFDVSFLLHIFVRLRPRVNFSKWNTNNKDLRKFIFLSQEKCSLIYLFFFLPVFNFDNSGIVSDRI